MRKHYNSREAAFIRANHLLMTYAEIGGRIGRSGKCISEYIRRQTDMPSKYAVVHAKRPNKSYRCFGTWAGMLTRCRNPKSPAWPLYGGRGITVCERWLKFDNFLQDMGEKNEGESIDRINPNGNYEPANCRWIQMREQSKTTRLYLSIKPCSDCGTYRGNYGSGRCHRCHEYFRRNGVPRMKTEGRVPMKPRPTKVCTNCKKEARPVCHNRCRSCAEYFRRTGDERPERLWSKGVPLNPSKARVVLLS